jgi:curved DNA-binding protein CbpA
VDEVTYYEILEVAPDATFAEIKEAYRRLTAKVHPDVGGSTALFHQVQSAYETISDPLLRARYDEQLESGGSADADNDARQDESSGWRRVDDPPPGPSQGGPAPPPPGPGAHEAQDPPPSSTPDPPRKPNDPAAVGFVKQNPSAGVLIAGVVIIWFGSITGTGLLLFGWLVVLAGIVGLIGRRRTRTRGTSNNPVEQLSSELRAGIPAITGALSAFFLSVAGSGRNQKTRRRKRR